MHSVPDSGLELISPDSATLNTSKTTFHKQSVGVECTVSHLEKLVPVQVDTLYLSQVSDEE